MPSLSLSTFIAVVAVLCITFGSSSNAVTSRDILCENSTTLTGVTTLLSPKASVSYNISSAPRWSQFDGPQPGAIVNVATEEDVVTIVNYCLEKNIPFVAQNGGHGWSNSWHLYQNGIIINLRGLNQTTFNANRTEARVGGGTIIGEMITQAYANDAQLVSGNCNCVGVVGAGLGGGYGNLMGLYGFSVDNYISMRIVLANGTLVAINEQKDPDLWWAMRGAGPNFGIVTSAVYKSYPVTKAQNTAWGGGLWYTEDKLEQVIQAIEDIDLKGHMDVFLFFLTTGHPNYIPTIMIAPFYLGTVDEGRTAFKSFIDIGPYNDTTAAVTYDHWNDVSQGFCTKGGRKPSFGVGHQHMIPSVWRQIWELFVVFSQKPGAGNGVVLTECYSLEYAQAIPKTSTSFANRHIRFNSVAIPWYYDEGLDGEAVEYGSKVRTMLRETSGLSANRTYVNFAYGDETNEVVYDVATDRLKTLKARYDPNDVFSHWFPIQV